jgi:hypothetical protein
MVRGDLQLAGSLLVQALELARRAGNREVEVASVYNLGMFSLTRGNRSDSECYILQSQAMAAETGDRQAQARLLTQLGVLAIELNAPTAPWACSKRRQGGAGARNWRRAGSGLRAVPGRLAARAAKELSRSAQALGPGIPLVRAGPRAPGPGRTPRSPLLAAGPALGDREPPQRWPSPPAPAEVAPRRGAASGGDVALLNLQPVARRRGGAG